MGSIVTGCAHQPTSPTVVPAACPPVILAKPIFSDRPEIFLKYKIEEGKEWFALDKEGYIDLRDYVLELEGALDFVTQEIDESNKQQSERLK